MRGHLSTSGQGGGGERCCLPASAGVPKPSAPCGGWCTRCWPHPQQPGGALGAAAFPPSGRVSGWRQIYRLLENGARVLPSPPHPTPPTLPPHTSQQGRGLRNVCGLEAQPLPKSALGPNGRPASQGPLNGSHRDSGQAGLPSPGAWSTWEAPDPTAEGPHLPPPRGMGRALNLHPQGQDRCPRGGPSITPPPSGCPSEGAGGERAHSYRTLAAHGPLHLPASTLPCR